MNAMCCRFRKKKLFPSRQEMLFALLPDVPRDTENAAYLINGSCIYGAFLADDGSWDYELYDIKLTPIESGQLGEDRNMTREEVTREVLSWRNLEKKERTYFAPTEDFVDLCNYCYSNEKMIKEYYYGF